MFGNTTEELPSAQPRPANIQPERTNTNQEAVVVPYTAGTVRLALHWITQAYNRQISPVRQTVGSGKRKKTHTTGYDYYADLAGLAGYGVADSIDTLYIDNEAVADFTIQRDPSQRYTETTLGQTTIRVHWGTETQNPADFLFLNTATTGIEHPGYRGYVIIEFKRLYLGRDKTSAPSVQVALSRPSRYGTLPDSSTSRGANPITVLAEIIGHHRHGLNRPDLINEGSFRSLAMQLTTKHVSPHITREQRLRNVIGNLFEYFDGWMRIESGKIVPGWIPHTEPPSSLTVIDERYLTEKPKLQPASWADTYNRVTVSYTNRERDYKEDALKADSPANRQITAEVRKQTVQRPWIIESSHALEYAEAYIATYAQPHIAQASLRCYYQHLDDRSLKPGDYFHLQYAPLQLDITCRIQSISFPSPDSLEAEVQFIQERGTFPQPYTSSIDAPPATLEYTPPTLTTTRIIELPSSLVPGNKDYHLLFLAERPDTVTAGYHIHYSRASVTYDLLGDQETYPLLATVTTEYPDTAGDAQTHIDDDIGLELTITHSDIDDYQPQSDEQRDDNHLLLFIGEEILSIGDIQALGNNSYRLTTKRARYATERATHAAGTEAWLIYREEINPLTHHQFPNLSANELTAFFKLQPYTLTTETDLSTINPITHNWANRPTDVIYLNPDLANQAQPDGDIINFIGKLDKVRSSNYQPGLAGFQIDGTGNAEFNDVTVRGTIDSSTLNSSRLETGVLSNDFTLYNPTRPNVTFPVTTHVSGDNQQTEWHVTYSHYLSEIGRAHV